MTKMILAAAVALVFASPAFAAGAFPDEQAPTQAVSMRKVDFSNPDQVKHFYAKLRGAAVAVCDNSTAYSQFSQSCVVEVMADAVKAADKPLLTAMYNHANSDNRAYAGNDQ